MSEVLIERMKRLVDGQLGGLAVGHAAAAGEPAVFSATLSNTTTVS